MLKNSWLCIYTVSYLLYLGIGIFYRDAYVWDAQTIYGLVKIE